MTKLEQGKAFVAKVEAERGQGTTTRSKMVDIMTKWTNPQSLADLEAALDGGMLYIAMTNGSWLLLRRNGATKRWKRDAGRFRVPVKAGMYFYIAITETSDMVNYRIAESRENAEAPNA